MLVKAARLGKSSNRNGPCIAGQYMMAQTSNSAASPSHRYFIIGMRSTAVQSMLQYAETCPVSSTSLRQIFSGHVAAAGPLRGAVACRIHGELHLLAAQ